VAIRVFHRDNPGARLEAIASDARLVVWPGVGAETANMNYVVMQPGEENAIHSHPESDDTIAILEGRGTVVDHTAGVALPFEAGQVINIGPAIEHQVKADRGTRVVSVGGPCPADLRMLRAAGVLD
jgi:quercetin dioxygenase-like cupin family protein